MRIGVAATPDVALPTLNWLLHSEHELVRVITQPDRKSGRGLDLKQSVVALWAKENKIDVVKPLDFDETKSVISDLDLLITIGYGVILPESLLDIPKFGCINLHFSLLPKYRGAAPVQRAIESGETASGVTVFKLDKGMDTGPIYSQMAIDIDSKWRSFELFSELSIIGVEAIEQSLSQITQGHLPKPQAGQHSHAGKITKEEAKLDWAADPKRIINKIRAFYPAPICWTIFRGDNLKITKVGALSNYSKLAPGQIGLYEGECLIGVTGGALVIEKVVPLGKREMFAVEFARGARFGDAEFCG